LATLKDVPNCGKSGLGLGLVDLPEIGKFTIPGGLQAKLKLSPSEENFCSKCGEFLSTTCLVCNGTGDKQPPEYDPKYCPACGRLLSKKRIRRECPHCHGKGRIKRTHVCEPEFGF